MPAFVWPDIHEACAVAYAAAARAGADMRAATAAFEGIRDAHTNGKDIFTMRATILDQIGRADLEKVVPLLSTLRHGFEQAAIAAAIADLQATYSRNAIEGWRAWLILYVECFGDRAWWRTLAMAIAKQALPYTPSPEWPTARILRTTEATLRGYWPETLDWFLFLATQDLPSEHRATMLAIAAEIEIYHFVRPRRAKDFLEQATSLAPNDSTVLRVWGAYWLLMDEVDRAQDQFEKLLNTRPELADGFVGLGDCGDKKKDTAVAESYYTQAVVNAPGAYDAVVVLLRWYSRPEYFPPRESAVKPLFQRAFALAEYKPQVPTELAWAYHANRRYDEAREHFLEARRLDEQYQLPYVGLGYCDLEQARALPPGEARAESVTRGRTHFAKAIELSPSSLDGYWGMSALAEEEGLLDEALSWCDRAVDWPRDWEPNIRVRQAELKKNLAQLEEAERDLLQALSLEPTGASALAQLLDLASSYEKRGDREAAARVLQKWRDIKGTPGEATFQNGIGNLMYTAADYAAAAVHYRLAVAASPQDHVLHSNLARALENLREAERRLATLDEAARALETAIEIRPQEAEYVQRLATVNAERRFIQAYGEPALAFDPIATPIRVDIGEELFPDFLNASHDRLSNETLQVIEAMRQDVRERVGIEVPGVRFFELTNISHSNYRILIMERTEYSGEARPGRKFAPDGQQSERSLVSPTPPTGAWIDKDAAAASPYDPARIWTVTQFIVRHVQNVAEAHLDQFVDHEEATRVLRDAGSVGESIASDPLELTSFVQVLKTLVRRHVPLTSAGNLVQQFAHMRSARADIDRISASLARQSPVVSRTTENGRH